MFESRAKWPSSFKKNLVLYFCKILLKLFLIRIIYRSAMATTSVYIILSDVQLGLNYTDQDKS